MCRTRSKVPPADVCQQKVGHTNCGGVFSGIAGLRRTVWANQTIPNGLALTWQNGLVKEIQEQMVVMGWTEPPLAATNGVHHQQLEKTKKAAVRAKTVVKNIHHISQGGANRSQAGLGAFVAPVEETQQETQHEV